MCQRDKSNGHLVATCLSLWLCLDAHAAQPGTTEDQTLAEVIVTGTRLAVTQADTTAPVTVLDRRDLERGGADSIGKVVQTLPMNTGSPPNTNVNNGGDGSTRVDLRGLGPDRTLVLLNGRRFPNGGIGGDASVDLNTLPISWIERIEVLASGASAVYGADAVGGVVNVITRRAYDGVELSGNWTMTERGDGQIVRGQAAIGFDLFGGNWGLGVEYVEQDSVRLDQRSHSAIPLVIVDGDGNVGYGGTLANQDGLFEVPAENVLGLAPNDYTRFAGAAGQTAADYRPFTAADRFNVQPFNYSQTPSERGSLWLFGSLPLDGNVRASLETLVHQRDSEQELAPDLYFIGIDPAPMLADGATGIPATNYYNPFGVDLPFVTRRFVERGVRQRSEDIDLWRAVLGLEGEVGEWTWKLAIGYAESDATTTTAGISALSRYVPALGPSGPDDSGRIVCGPPDPATGRVPAENIIPECVPLNLFGGAGSITQEQLDYMFPGPVVDSGMNEQRIAEAVMSGPAGHILGNELQWVFGAEYRREAGSLVGDQLRELFSGGVPPGLPAGTFDVRELFAEVHIPLLRNRASARDLALNVGARWSDFSSFDRNTVWQAGLRWQPAEQISLRANYAEVFRAPSLFELFESRVIAPGLGFDPCGNDPTPTQQENCASNGVPGGAYVQGDNEFGTLSGGNPELEPEKGDSVGVGVIYSPLWARGLSASLDYFEIELTDFIGVADIDTVLFECAERGVPTVCDAIRRFPDGSVSFVSVVGRNLGRLETSGFDFALNWRMTTRLGYVNAELLATYLERWDEQTFADGEVLSRAGWGDGVQVFPRCRALGHIDWQRGRWMASYAAEYIGGFSQAVTDFPPWDIFFDPYTREVESALYHDLEGGYEFDAGLSVRAAITNVTDEDPPFVNFGANTNYATYRLLGRTYFVELRYEFH
jgi:iron complex outermembrane recepter protein